MQGRGVGVLAGLLVAAALVAAALVGCGCDNRVDAESVADLTAAETLEVDAQVEEDLADPDGHAEARAWLADDGHETRGLHKDEVALLVEKLYETGAEAVYVTRIEATGDGQRSASLVAQLPDHALARIRIFDVEARFYALDPNDAPTDQGQRYLTFEFE